ncbi:MAG: N-acetylmuramoyl-L-alanine amidase family protein [Halanaerobiaceae bacterium]
MKKITAFILIFIFIFIIPLQTVQASGAEKYLNRSNITNLAKGVAALYLINRLSSYVSDRNVDEGVENSGKEDESGRQEVKSMKQVDDMVIVLDAGHGGFDPGAVGPGGLEEKEVVLDVTLKLADMLRENTGASVYLTREKDSFISLPGRVSRANNWDADVFISIHSNGGEDGIERGIETYADYGSSSEAWAMAWYIQESLVKELKLPDRGLKANSFHVTRETVGMDSLLLEIGYITHQEEEILLGTGDFRKRAAKAIYNGLVNYFSPES